jgi:hypothetical protein
MRWSGTTVGFWLTVSCACLVFLIEAQRARAETPSLASDRCLNEAASYFRCSS